MEVIKMSTQSVVPSVLIWRGTRVDVEDRL